MEIITISQAKNHLPKLIHAAEAGDDIRISRQGKLVAVLVSAERYQQRFTAGEGVFQAMMHWRENHADFCLTDADVESWRDRSLPKDFA
jgi:prevent-host-death family protein